ncbi:MAG TPA: hypothetical protein VGT07_13235 [Steroidobacteraceae bacterium]|nr:hypothetical protein [Steroidobacteraceae bacterium]
MLHRSLHGARPENPFQSDGMIGRVERPDDPSADEFARYLFGDTPTAAEFAAALGLNRPESDDA